MGYERNWVALSSTATSTYTSSSFLVADAATISISVVTTAGVASLWTGRMTTAGRGVSPTGARLPA